MLAELLRPAGPELARRWLAALLLAPEGERAAIVAEVERRMAEAYGQAPASRIGDAEAPELTLRGEPAQREGYIEQTVRTYQPASAPRPGAARKKQRGT